MFSINHPRSGRTYYYPPADLCSVSFVISLLISAIVLLIWFWTRSWLVPGTIPENYLTDNHFHLILEARDFESSMAC
jgi:hypothetical protein